MKEATHSAHWLVRAYLFKQMARSRVLLCAKRALALLVVVELGLLSPLLCILHCALYRSPVAQPAYSRFICSMPAMQARSTRAGVPTGDMPTVPAPRPFYELLQLASPVLLLAAAFVALLAPSLRAPLCGSPLAPPTPPPRLSFV